MATTWIKPIHKGASISSKLKSSTSYAKDFSKTEGGEYIVAYECDARTVDAEFLFSKSMYGKLTGRDQGRQDVIAYHIRQSFAPGDVTTEQALAIGYDLAMRWTKGRHQFIVAAHTNTNNPHTHIIFNSTNLEHNKKFRNFKWSSIALRRLSDQICLENGLSIIENPAPSKGFNRKEYLGEKKPPTAREQLRTLMDTAVLSCKSFEEFLRELERVGVKIKRGKQLAFKLPSGKNSYGKIPLARITLWRQFLNGFPMHEILQKLFLLAKAEPNRTCSSTSSQKCSRVVMARGIVIGHR